MSDNSEEKDSCYVEESYSYKAVPDLVLCMLLLQETAKVVLHDVSTVLEQDLH